jgi:hypothetical protein
MRQSFAVLLGALALLGSVSGALAQRDGADRGGGRLDSQEFRNDMAQDRLKQPAPPPSAQPVLAPKPAAKPKRKPKTQN